jgi:hypothetical protein
MFRLLFALSLALCLASPAQGILDQLFGGGANQQRKIETAYRKVRGTKLGTHLASQFAGKKVLLLLPPEMPPMPGEGPVTLPYKAVLEGLEKGMAGKLTVVGKIEPRMPAEVKAQLQKAMVEQGFDNMAMMPQAQMWFDVPALEKELAPYKGKYDLLVCLASLPGVDMMMPMAGGKRPVPLNKLSIMAEKDVKLVLAQGGIAKFGRVIQARKVVAAVTYKQNITEEAFTQMPPQDLDAAFNMRYVLITPENLQKNAIYFRR